MSATVELAETGVDVADFGSLAWLRRASGDAWIRPWRLTPERLAAYAAGLHALARGGWAVEAEDPGAVLDPDRQALLRPWEARGPERSTGPDRVAVLTAALAARPALAAAVRPQLALDAFVAAHLQLTVCVRALVLLAGDDAGRLDEARVRAWADAQRPRDGAEADFAASLVTAAGGRDVVARGGVVD